MLGFALRSASGKVAHLVDGRKRRWKFGRAMQRFLKLDSYADIPDALLSELVENWNNSWSAQEEYIRAFITAAAAASGPILECGSGLSTLLLGAVAQKIGNAVWTLEHEPAWLDRMERDLARFGINSVQIRLTPLRSFGEYSWYDAPFTGMPTDFNLVVCDGPPGVTPGGRYGFLPKMKNYCRSGCTILLDDAARPSENAVLERWAAQLQVAHTIEGAHKPFGRLILP